LQVWHSLQLRFTLNMYREKLWFAAARLPGA
jgi:hypothetical protein